jgi:pilus assembly protein CpaD
MKTKAIQVSTVFLAALSAAGCTYSDAQIAMMTRDHTQLRAVEVDAELAIGPGSSGLPLGSREQYAVRAFAASYQSEGRGPIVISHPAAQGDEGAGLSTDLRALLLAEGVDDRDIVEGRYVADNPGLAPVRLNYKTLEAKAGDCPDLSSIDVTNVVVNAAMPSFGCAVATNLAAMIADPSDLVGDHPMDPPDATRRTVVFTKYRAGEPTGGAKNAGASGGVSSAVGN